MIFFVRDFLLRTGFSGTLALNLAPAAGGPSGITASPAGVLMLQKVSGKDS